MKIEELIDRGDETGQRIRETLNVLLESPYFYKTDDERLFLVLTRYKRAFESFFDKFFGWTLVRQSIDEYLKDGREHLQVAFGCTGGQHRSVYFADRMSERLAGTDGVEIEVIHTCGKLELERKEEDERGIE